MPAHPGTQTIEFWPIDKLAFYPTNPRKNDAVVERMVASIEEYGFKIPVLARSDGEVVDGHLRLKAAKRLGIHEVPVILCDEWTPVQVKAFRLMVNRSVTWAEWDETLLSQELIELKNLDYDLNLTGFDDDELTPEFDAGYRAARRAAFSQSIARLQQASSAAVSTLLKVLIDPKTPPSTKVRASECVLNHAAKAIEIEDIEARVAELERAAAQSARSER